MKVFKKLSPEQWPGDVVFKINSSKYEKEDVTLLFMNHFSRKSKRINRDKTRNRIAQGQQRARSEDSFKNMAHEKKKECSLNPRLNDSIVILLKSVIAIQHWPG